MKKSIKKAIYTTVWLSSLALTNVNAAMQYDQTPVDERLKGTDNTLDVVLQNWLSWLTGFLYFIAIAMMIWGWFNILTAWWEEEKVKKWKTILMQAAAWLIVIFLANSLISWIITLLFNQA